MELCLWSFIRRDPQEDMIIGSLCLSANAVKQVEKGRRDRGTESVECPDV